VQRWRTGGEEGAEEGAVYSEVLERVSEEAPPDQYKSDAGRVRVVEESSRQKEYDYQGSSHHSCQASRRRG